MYVVWIQAVTFHVFPDPWLGHWNSVCFVFSLYNKKLVYPQYLALSWSPSTADPTDAAAAAAFIIIITVTLGSPSQPSSLENTQELLVLRVQGTEGNRILSLI